MKKLLFYIFTLVIIISFIGCTQHQISETSITPNEMVSAIVESQPELPTLIQAISPNKDFITYLSDYYMIDTKQIKDGAIYYSDGIEASEIAVLILADEKESETIQSAFTEYIKNRANVFEGYAPQQATLVKNGIIEIRGKYVALLICNDTSAAKTAFLNCFKEKEKSSSDISFISNSSSQTNKKIKSNTDSYNHDAVLQAYKTKDISNLSEMNVCILNAAKDVISQEIKDNMSNYEKELTIHDWITNHSSFDYSVFNRSSNNEFADGSDTPYGVLIDHSAMCHGYSSTFQLFMDILDIECITVFGTPNSNGVEHSWNMVKLDGEWYCVDTAWDDPIGGNPGHNYFNVTSEHLRKGSIHRWDENNIPEATATTYAYYN